MTSGPRHSVCPSVRGAGALALLLAACGCSVSPATVDFHFAPPENVTWERKQDHSERVNIAGLVSQDWRVTIRSAVNVTRRSSWTLAWDEKIEGFDVVVDGSSIRRGLPEQVAGLEVTTELMDDGDVTALQGQDRVEALVAQVAATNQRWQNPRDVRLGYWSRRENVRAAWRERVRALAGKRLKLGETVESRAVYSLSPQLRFVHRAVLTPRQRKRCGEAECVAVAVEYASDPKGTARLLGERVDSPLLRSSGEQEEPPELLTIEGVEVSGGGERLVEPATLIVREERTEKKIRLRLSGADGRAVEVLVTVVDQGSMTPKS